LIKIDRKRDCSFRAKNGRKYGIFNKSKAKSRWYNGKQSKEFIRKYCILAESKWSSKESTK
jgi:hypothetical protein